MNRIYSLRYSIITCGLIAVPEFTKKCIRRLSCHPVLAHSVAITLLLSSSAGVCGTVNNELPYQLFRDFSENKGVFHPGNINIPIYTKQHKQTGILNQAKMPDFSSVDSHLGVATLIDPQYIVSVRHNGGYKNVSFGDGENRYNIVDRNNSPSLDFHAPRLDKLVTEVAPSPITAQGAVPYAYLDKKRYPVFYRLGSGTQYIKNQNGQLTYLSGAYSYLTGGTVNNPSSYQNGAMITTSSGLVFNYNANGAMPIYGESGDSGSPLFAWDTTQNKWVLVGVLTAGNGAGGRGNNWAVIPLPFIKKTMEDDNDSLINFNLSESSIPLSWSFDSNTGTGTLVQKNSTYTMHGKQGSDINAGKNLIFSGKDGIIKLLNDINQGAGTLRFKNNYTVTSPSGNIWTGGGIITDKETTVTWQVNGAANDNLHKIGKGTLIINGTGNNEGGLKVGDGTVILNQQPDTNNQVQAFNNINIASGRPTVILTDNRQITPDNISWGYRGGTLDVNGNDLLFHRINAADYGAVLANNATTSATVTLNYAIPDNIPLHSWSESRHGTVGDLYEYSNPYTHTTDYFLLKTENYGYFPGWQTNNNAWEYVGHNRMTAQILAMEKGNTPDYMYHGQLKGNMNVKNRIPRGNTSSLVLDGSADISGTLFQENGRLTLQGHPVIHAYNSQSLANKLASMGDTSLRTQPTTFNQDDWERRTFNFGRLQLQNTIFGLGRNATLNTTIYAYNSIINLGDDYVFIDKKDGNGTTILLEKGISPATKDEDKSIFNGIVTLIGHTGLNITNSVFNGHVTGYTGTTLHLDGLWNMNKSSVLDTFDSHGGILSLIQNKWSPKTLTVNTINAHNLSISLGVNTENNTNDRLDILNQATGKNNILILPFLLDQIVKLKEDLTLVSAPLGTPHEYFTFASLSKGFTTYTPDTQVIDKEGKTLWQLKHNVPLPVPDSSTSTPAAPDNSTGHPAPDTPQAPIRPTTPAGGDSSNSIFKGKDNSILLNKARKMFAVRQFLLRDSGDRWSQTTDNINKKDGLWISTRYSPKAHNQFTLKQNGLDIGFKYSISDNYWWGMAAELYRGSYSTNSYNDDFNLGGISVIGGKIFDKGIFIDGITGYKQLSENVSINDELSDLSGSIKSHAITAGIRTGWNMHIEKSNMTITPSISLNTMIINNNHLSGIDRTVELQSGSSLWLTAGIQAEKKYKQLSIQTGLYHNITLNETPAITLSDNWKTRNYHAEKNDGYTISAGIEGKITENIYIQAKLNSNLNGYFNKNNEGVLSIRYNF